MNILQKIIEHKKIEVAEAKKTVSVAELEKRPFFGREVLSLQASLLDTSKTGIIAEFKRKSPSKGVINDKASVVEVTKGYTDAGAACLSVLTDRDFFGGTPADLEAARVNAVPILRKDFIVDEYQILEARAMGADVILLIAACLKPKEVKHLAQFAAGLGLEVLLEIHGDDELDHICGDTPIVGVNNRDLKTFTVDIERSIRLSQQLPVGKLLIAESGINRVETIRHMRDSGFHGFLVGEHFMKDQNPAIAFASFVQQLKSRR